MLPDVVSTNPIVHWIKSESADVSHFCMSCVEVMCTLKIAQILQHL